MDRKPKFTFYQEPSSAPMAPQVSNGTPAPRPPVQPTPETQGLYNEMRQEEERSLMQEFLQQVQDGTNDHLQLPSPSQATTSSPSHGGSTTNSIAGALHEVDLNNKPKRGRKGRLSEANRRRANLMRKLKACEDCSRRRVKCTHHDLTLFEAAYKRTRADGRAPAQAPDPSTSTWDSAGLYQPSLGEPNDFVGIGGVHDSAFQPATAPSGGRDNNQTDFDPLREQTQHQHSSIRPHLLSALNSVENQFAAPNPGPQYQSTAPSYSLPMPPHTGTVSTTPATVTGSPHGPAPTSHPMVMRRSRGPVVTPHRIQTAPARRVTGTSVWTRPFERYLSTAQAVPTSAFQGIATTSQLAPTAPYQAPAVAPRSLSAGPPVLIGKQESFPYGSWMCGVSFDGAGASAFPGASVPCNDPFSTLEGLKEHYQWFHAPFYNEVSYWVCGGGCWRVLTEEPSPSSPCQQCRQFTMQRWHWANVRGPATSASSPLGRVTSQDGTPSSHSSQTGYSTQLSSPPGGGYSNPYTSYPTGGYYRYPSSSGQYSNCAQQADAAQSGSEKDVVARATGEDDTPPPPPPPPPSTPTPPPPYYESDSKTRTIISSPAYPYSHSALCPLSGSTTAADVAKNIGALLFRHRIACPALAVLLVAVITLVEGWLSTGGIGGDGSGVLAQMCAGVVALREGGNGRGAGVGVDVGGCVVGMEELAVACIGAGWLAMSLYRHVKVRVRRQREREARDLWDVGEVVEVRVRGERVGVAW